MTPQRHRTGFIAVPSTRSPFGYKILSCSTQNPSVTQHPPPTHPSHLQWPDSLNPSLPPSSRPSPRSRSSSSYPPSHLSQSPSLPSPTPRLRHIHNHLYHPPPGPYTPPTPNVLPPPRIFSGQEEPSCSTSVQPHFVPTSPAPPSLHDLLANPQGVRLDVAFPPHPDRLRIHHSHLLWPLPTRRPRS
jgi:hypothetical protein